MTRTRQVRVVTCVTALAVSAVLAERAPLARRSFRVHAQQSTATFTRDVAPIVFSACASCHRPDGVAPFSLLTYQDVKSRGAQIVAATRGSFKPWRGPVR